MVLMCACFGRRSFTLPCHPDTDRRNDQAQNSNPVIRKIIHKIPLTSNKDGARCARRNTDTLQM